MESGNILKIDSLDEGWRDKDTVVLHVCFWLLKDCVEKESLLDGRVDWEAGEMHRLARKEIKDIYNRWLFYEGPGDPNAGESYTGEAQILLPLIKIGWELWA